MAKLKEEEKSTRNVSKVGRQREVQELITYRAEDKTNLYITQRKAITRSAGWRICKTSREMPRRCVTLNASSASCVSAGLLHRITYWRGATHTIVYFRVKKNKGGVEKGHFCGSIAQTPCKRAVSVKLAVWCQHLSPPLCRQSQRTALAVNLEAAFLISHTDWTHCW